MFYDNLKSICDKKGLKITSVVTSCGGALGSISKWRNGANPNSDIVIRLSLHLGVTSDYLLLGREPEQGMITPDTSLDEDQGRLLHMFSLLSEREKGEILGELKVLTKNKEVQENVG